jgi:hypothetical protein
MLLIGSYALKYHFPTGAKNRKAKDWDFVTEEKLANIISPNGRIEFHNIPALYNYKDSIISPDDLYTLKLSHLIGWDINWNKHMFDAVFLKENGCTLNKELVTQLYEHWTQIHGLNKRSDLDMTSEQFFDNALKGKYDHDYLHSLINPNPIYKKVLADGRDVTVDESKYNDLSYEDKLDLVREEVYVMAYERLNNRDYRAAYDWMLKKFIINHAPLYEALFIVDNFNVLRKPIINYKQKLDYELSRTQR